MKAVILVLALVSAAACSRQPEAQASTIPSTNSPSTPNADFSLAAAVRDALQQQESLHGIDVRIGEGTAILTGTVATSVEKDAAAAAAKSVPGVLAVDNQLTVRG